LEHFYCIKCRRIIEIGQAAILFRTGYYKTVYRMGCCSSCKEALK